MKAAVETRRTLSLSKCPLAGAWKEASHRGTKGKAAVEIRKTLKKERTLYFVLSPLLLVIGIAIYFLFRKNDGMVLFDWLPGLRARKGLAIQVDKNRLATLAVYSVPDGLWLLSGMLLMRALWWATPKTGTVYAFIFCALAAGFELLQMTGHVPGTFDPADLVVLVCAAFVEGFIFKCFIKRRKP
jgi:hypothetical protein